MGPKMDPKSKKNGIENKSDFKTKLEGRMPRSEGKTWTGPAPLGASHMRARSFLKTKNQGKKGQKEERNKGRKEEKKKGRRDERKKRRDEGMKGMKGRKEERKKERKEGKRDLSRHGPEARRIYF